MEHLLLFIVFLFVTKLTTGSFTSVPKHQEERLPFALEKIRDKMCTIHLAWDSNNIKTTQYRDRIIHDNKGQWLFTILNPKPRQFLNQSVESIFYIPPSIHFFEDCSIQLLIEKPAAQGNEYAAWLYYFYTTRYPMSLEGLNNILIIVRFLSSQFNSIWNTDKAINLPMEHFFHFAYVYEESEKVDLNGKHQVFPNTIVCRQCKHIYYPLTKNSTIYYKNELQSLKAKGEFRQTNLFVWDGTLVPEEYPKPEQISLAIDPSNLCTDSLWTHHLTLRLTLNLSCYIDNYLLH